MYASVLLGYLTKLTNEQGQLSTFSFYIYENALDSMLYGTSVSGFVARSPGPMESEQSE